uniref:Candidate secreted effector n=1 Tax=Meloidogyne incognita TaxID=6306 RepID=A0A914KU29_MELIC
MLNFNISLQFHIHSHHFHINPHQLIHFHEVLQFSRNNMLNKLICKWQQHINHNNNNATFKLNTPIKFNIKRTINIQTFNIHMGAFVRNFPFCFGWERKEN